MQSIYMFRQAEVELFERTKRYGLGEGTATVHLAPLQLQTNFRSHAGLVNRLNEIFEQIFEPATGQDYQVAFAPSTANCPAPRGNPGVTVWPFFSTSRPSTEEKRSAEDTEARRVVSIIQEHLPAVEAAKRKQGKFRIAVLVRARTHLELIARRLRKAEIPFRAVEIEQLSQRQEVKDLTALTRALLHPMDRIAWLTRASRAMVRPYPEGPAYARRVATRKTIPNRQCSPCCESGQLRLVKMDSEERRARLRYSKMRCAGSIARSLWRNGLNARG